MKRKTVVTAMMFAVALMTAMADVAPPPGALETEGILKSFQSPVFPSFWMLWGGLVIVSLALFFMRSFLRVTAIGLGVLMLIIGLVTGAKNYDYCEKCGTKLERWYDMGRHVACPKCRPEIKYRHLSEHLRKAATQPESSLSEAVKFRTDIRQHSEKRNPGMKKHIESKLPSDVL